jgi:hypothetical protein
VRLHEAAQAEKGLLYESDQQQAHVYARRIEVSNHHKETEMSGVIQKETSVAAGLVNDNIFSGSAFEYVRQPGVVSIAAVASATGGFITIQAGPTLILEESPPTVKTSMPVVPDDFLYQSAVVPGDRLVLRFRNPTGGALTIRAVAQLSP